MPWMPLGTVRAALRYADTSRDYADTQILGYGYEPQRIQIHEWIPARPKATKRIVLGYPCHAHTLTHTQIHTLTHTHRQWRTARRQMAFHGRCRWATFAPTKHEKASHRQRLPSCLLSLSLASLSIPLLPTLIWVKLSTHPATPAKGYNRICSATGNCQLQENANVLLIIITLNGIHMECTTNEIKCYILDYNCAA